MPTYSHRASHHDLSSPMPLAHTLSPLQVQDLLYRGVGDGKDDGELATLLSNDLGANGEKLSPGTPPDLPCPFKARSSARVAHPTFPAP